MAADDSPVIGARVGPFVVRERLSEHCGDSRYLADGEHGRVELSTFPTDDGARFEREAQVVLATLRDLAHPRLRPIAAAGTHGPLGWTAVALDEGVPLLEWCVSRPWTEVLAVMREVGQILSDLEPTGLRTDVIFPDDIRVASDGHPRVDVALRMILDRLRTGGMLGHRDVRYMCPEQHPTSLDPESAPATARSPRSTQHLFCVITWEVLYGRYPFVHSSVLQLFMAQTDGVVADPPPGTKVPEAIRQALVRGMAGDPAARWPSMQALLAALAPPPPPPPRGLLARLFGRQDR